MIILPFQVDFDITMKCMYNCLHCNVSAGEKMEGELTTEQIKKILDEIDEIGVSDVSITGGEPLLREDCLEILTYASKKKGFFLTLNTNGILLTEKKIKYLKENCPELNIAISLDGYNIDTYGILRKTQNGEDIGKYFNTIIQNLKILMKNQMTVGINYTITAQTIHNIWKTYDFIHEFGISKMLGIKFFPYGNGKKNNNQLELEYKVWEKFLQELIERKKRDTYYKDLQISVTCPWEMYLPLLEKGYSRELIRDCFEYTSPLESGFYKKYRNVGCHAGITSFAISPNGDVYPCGTISSKFPPFVCGNLKKSKLIDIWNDSQVLKQLRNLDICNIEGKCKECDYVDLCGGGCRARSYVKYGYLTARDYLCPYNK